MLGLDTLVSQAYGRRDHDECHRWLAQGVYLACIITPPLMILIAALSFGFTRFGVIPEVAKLSGGYLRILNWGTLPLLLYGGTRRYLQGVGQVRVITVTYVLANLLNWFGNWVLIYGKLRHAGARREWFGDLDVHCARRRWRRLCWALRGVMSANAGIRCSVTGPGRNLNGFARWSVSARLRRGRSCSKWVRGI